MQFEELTNEEKLLPTRVKFENEVRFLEIRSVTPKVKVLFHFQVGHILVFCPIPLPFNSQSPLTTVLLVLWIVVLLFHSHLSLPGPVNER